MDPSGLLLTDPIFVGSQIDIDGFLFHNGSLTATRQGYSQGNRTNRIGVAIQTSLFKISNLHFACSHNLDLCGFLSFWGDSWRREASCGWQL